MNGKMKPMYDMNFQRTPEAGLTDDSIKLCIDICLGVSSFLVQRTYVSSAG